MMRATDILYALAPVGVIVVGLLAMVWQSMLGNDDDHEEDHHLPRTRW